MFRQHNTVHLFTRSFPLCGFESNRNLRIGKRGCRSSHSSRPACSLPSRLAPQNLDDYRCVPERFSFNSAIFFFFYSQPNLAGREKKGQKWPNRTTRSCTILSEVLAGRSRKGRVACGGRRQDLCWNAQTD